MMLTARKRYTIIGASLLALFLGALDSLVMSAAMPTVVADLGAIHLYSWVYSAYFLARAVSLPIFGKMADMYKNRTLFLVAIGIFLFSSIAAGFSPNMEVLIGARVLQGIGAGGVFALVYIVLSDVSAPERRGKTLSLASSIWGISSVLGPTMGGFIVTFFSWRWIFFVNVPLGLFSLLGIWLYLDDVREKRKAVRLDLLGVFSLTGTVLALLWLFLSGGRSFQWLSGWTVLLSAVVIAFGVWFVLTEKRAQDPILDLTFFRVKGFRIGNTAAFMSSFTIFSFFAYAPLFIQGALGDTPMEVGLGMLTLSMGWSVGSLVLGQMVHRIGKRLSAMAGALCLIGGAGMSLFFSTATTMTQCVAAFSLVGLGMGFVTLSTLLVVQESLAKSDLGVATSSHQFARTLGGAVGIGISGGFVTGKLTAAVRQIAQSGASAGLSADTLENLRKNVESLFEPEFQSLLPPAVQNSVQSAVVDGVSSVFTLVFIVSVVCLILCWLLPAGDR